MANSPLNPVVGVPESGEVPTRPRRLAFCSGPVVMTNVGPERWPTAGANVGIKPLLLAVPPSTWHSIFDN